MTDALLDSFCAVVVAGGRATRLGGFDKASVEIDGRTLLEYALDAVVDAAEVVVVGEQVPTERPVTFTVESPRHGGPVAALLTGCDALLRRTRTVVVLAVDMPRLTPSTLRRLHVAAQDRDGAVLVDPDGRRQLALVLDRDRLAAVRPDHETQHDLALHRLLAPLDLAEVAAHGEEHRDVDTWTDLRDLRDPGAAPADEGAGRPAVVVRRLGPDEWERQRALRLASLADAPEAFGSSLAREEAFDEAVWRERLARPTSLVATRDGVDVGIAGVYEVDRGWSVMGMWVPGPARGTGVVEALVEACADLARAAGAGALTMGVMADNARGRAAYARLGFVPTGERHAHGGREELVLARDLRPDG